MVRNGFAPEFVPRIDPKKDPIEVALKQTDRSGITADRFIKGRVVDSNGNPIVRAIVDPVGEAKERSTRWGGMDAFDPIGLSDDDGRFMIASQSPFMALNVKVSAPGFARLNVNRLASGESHTIVMTKGVNVIGRALRDGKPLQNVAMGISGVTLRAGQYVGNDTIATDKHGRFVFLNQPPNTEYFLYGIMDSFQGKGAIPVQRIQSMDDGSITNVGDLATSRSYRVQGTVVLSDGQPIPQKTRLIIGREDAWDFSLVELKPDGKFDIAGVPRESISLGTRVKGYRLSLKNRSLDRLNQLSLVGTLERDITGLVILFEPGERYARDDPAVREYSGKSQPRDEPLRGAE